MRQASPELVSTPAALDALVSELAGVEELAVDTEFHRERSYYPHLALVQIAWRGGTALVDPLALDVSPLAKVLCSGALTVMHAAEHDLEVLARACGALPDRLFDTQLAAGFVGYSTPSLASLTESLLGVRLQKADQLTNWMQRPLTAGQIAYAASDVAHLLDLKEQISVRLEAAGRGRWASEECALLLRRDRSAVPPEEVWWRLPRLRRMRGASRGVAQEVAAWRERRARQLDVPPRFVLSDLAMLSVVQRPPANRQELQRVRGADARHLRGEVVDELLAAVRRGSSLPHSELHLPPPAPPDSPNKPAVVLASAYVGARSAELGIDPAIVATRADLVSFFAAGNGSGGNGRGRLASGWRAELVGAELRRLAEGAAALAVGADGALTLEERSGRPI